MYPGVDVVILAYNSGSLLSRTLPKILKTDYPKMNFIVIDNGSVDGTTDFINHSKFKKRVKLIKLDKNYGCAGGLNRSLPYLTSKYVAFLNEDIIPDKNWLKSSIKILESDKKIAAVMCKLVKPNTNEVEAASTVFDEITCAPNVSKTPRKETPYVGLGNTIFRTKLVKRIPIEEKYFLYYEDVDYSFRIKSLGYKIIANQESILYHFHQGSVRRNFTKAQVWRMNVRNRLLLFFRFYPIHKIILFYPFVLGRIILGGIKHTLKDGLECSLATLLGIIDSFDIEWILTKRKENRDKIWIY
ncbi:MAG: glycosyltransferase [Candidatus Micrarchaeia archaeon]